VAPYLKNFLPESSSIGTILACQMAITSFLGGLGGRLADEWEHKHPCHGRINAMKVGIFLGFFFSILEGLGNVLLPTSSLQTNLLGSNLLFWWNLLLRSGYGVSVALTAPVLDGLAIAHLKFGGGTDTMDYGKERLYGAVWWGIANFIIGITCDQYGFDIALFLAVMVSSSACYIVLSMYEANIVSREQQPDPDSTTTPDETSPLHKSKDIEQILIPPEKELESDEYKEKEADKSLLSLLFLAFSNPHRAAFSLAFFLLNLGMAVVENLIFLFYASTLGSSNTM